MSFDVPKPHRSARTGLGRAFAADQSGQVAIMFGLALPVLFGVVGLAIDYSYAVTTQSQMQAVADASALAGARQLQMAKSTGDTASAVVQGYVNSRFSDVAVDTQVDTKALTVKVTLDKDVNLTVGKAVWGGKMHVRVSATAKASASLPLCLLALDPKAPATLELEQSAQLTATGCMLYSDSTSKQGLQAKHSAVVTAGLICTAGGKAKTSNAKLTPDPVLDCPNMDDPLASRTPPAVGACTYTDTVVNGGTQTLRPGTYCKGLTITNGAEVTLSAGIYVIKDGPFVVDGGATLQGTDVGLYLKGNGANLTFDTASTISLSAPKSGEMAGILIFDDPTGAPALAIPPFPLPIPLLGGTTVSGPPREHKILSDNARMLLGTIYMPQGRLIIDASKPIADRSAYTVLVVQRIDLHDGPNLVLNSDYSATDVPVPQGVGFSGQISLTN